MLALWLSSDLLIVLPLLVFKMSQVIDGFVRAYQSDQAAYARVALTIEQRCRDLLEENHISAVVTSRAKCPMRLKEKLEKRNPELQYSTEADIRSNIPDLSGVRIALYFPSQQETVIQLLQQSFVPILVKKYDSASAAELSPPDSPQESPRNDKNTLTDVPTQHIFRPTGYTAVHLHMGVKADDPLRKYSRTTDAPRFEVQITTLLMHAWSEVDHDLAYKCHDKEPSNEETHVLSEINRHIVASEGLLRQLEQLVKDRNQSRRGN